MKKVRTRFAPSPTGFLHIGGIRTALYSYIFAKKNGGDFILRIEDTDQKREVPGAKEMIYESLKTAGIIYDEGPDVGGNYGPYIQSERREIYKKNIDELIEKDAAYYCFCTKERLDELKEEQREKKIPFRYDGHCRSLKKEEAEQRLAGGEAAVVRQKIPRQGTTTLHDAVYGEIKVENKDLDDAVLMKSDRLPTYNFANVVDDHLMEISHIIRGSEFLSSTPKFLLLYQAFDWEAPVHVHLPNIMKNAREKLSKRDADASFFDLLDRGYLKEAIINSIVLLGWNPKTEQEIFSMEELKQVFSLEGLNKAPAIFDAAKLNWMNSEYIHRLPLETFHAAALPYYKKVIQRSIDLKRLSEVIQTRIKVFSEIPSAVDFLEILPEYDTSLFDNKKMKSDKKIAHVVVTQVLKALEKLQTWNFQIINDTLFDVIKDMKLKNGQVLWPVRLALSGKEFTPGGAIEIAEILGKAETEIRLKKALGKLSQ